MVAIARRKLSNGAVKKIYTLHKTKKFFFSIIESTVIGFYPVLTHMVMLLILIK